MNDKSYEREMEVIQLSIYCDIIRDIINRYNTLSICKVVVFAYIIKQNKFLEKSCYEAQTKNNIVRKCISTIASEKTNFSFNLIYIIKSIDILISANELDFDKQKIRKTELTSNSLKYCNITTFIDNAIKNSINYSDKQFMTEVMYNV